MNTVLVVTADDALRTRLLRGLSGFTIFEAPSDTEVIKTLLLVEIDLVLQGQPLWDYSRAGLPDWDYAVTVARATQPERY